MCHLALLSAFTNQVRVVEHRNFQRPKAKRAIRFVILVEDGHHLSQIGAARKHLNCTCA